MSTKFEYRTSTPGHAGGKLVIDNFGRYIPAGDVGDTYFVDYRNGSDTINNGKSIGAAFKTLSKAYSTATTDNNDIIFVDGDSTVVESAMITWSKNRITVVGVGSNGRLIQQSAKIELQTTGVATDLAPVLVTGVRNSFIGIKGINSSTTNEALYGWIENGEGTYYQDFSSAKIAGLDDANHAHFWLAGDACSGRNLTFGHSTIASTAAAFGILIDGKSGGATSVVKETMWENVRVNMSVATGVVGTSAFIKIADNAAMNFVNSIDNFRGYHFIPNGQTILTDAILAAASTVSGVLLLTDPAFFGVTGVGAGSGKGVYFANSGAAPDANGGLAIVATD